MLKLAVLEDGEVAGFLGDHGNDLDAGRPRANDAHPLAREVHAVKYGYTFGTPEQNAAAGIELPPFPG
jgi:hypothetical protein